MQKGLKLDVILALNALPMSETWRLVYEKMSENREIANKKVELSVWKAKMPDIYTQISKRKLRSFNVIFDNFMLSCSPVTAWGHVVLGIWDDSPQPICDWAQVARAFSDYPGFVQAWLSDGEYNVWQNAIDPQQYKVAGLSYEGLPMKHNGMPPPMDRMEIDISDNPCRRIIRQGYVEAIGAHMWLGEEFWKRSGSDKERVVRTFQGCHKNLGDGVLELRVSDKLFTDDSDADLQNKLREALYS